MGYLRHPKAVAVKRHHQLPRHARVFVDRRNGQLTGFIHSYSRLPRGEQWEFQRKGR